MLKILKVVQDIIAIRKGKFNPTTVITEIFMEAVTFQVLKNK